MLLGEAVSLDALDGDIAFVLIAEDLLCSLPEDAVVFELEKSFHLRQPSKSISACMQPHSVTLRESQSKFTG